MSRRWRGLAITLLVAIAGCSAPQYDDQTDKLITQLQTDVDTQIVSLISLDHRIASLSKSADPAAKRALADAKAKAGYDANAGFYDKVDVDIITLQTRIDAEPSGATPFLDAAVKNLSDNLVGAEGSMRTTHQQVDILSVAYLTTAQKLVDAQIGALLTRELGLKAGASGSK